MMRTRTTASSDARGAAAALIPLRARDLFRYLLAEKPAFLFLNVYMFFEYVRPQSLYPVIDVLPYGTLALAGVLISFVLEGRGIRMRSPADAMLGAYLVIVLLSSVVAYSPEYAYENLYVFISWVLVYFLIVNIVVTESRLFIFTLGFLLYSFKMSQHGTRSWAAIGFQFRDWGTYGAPGWFQNSGEFGIQMTIFFPLALYVWIELRKQWPWWKSLLFVSMPVTAVLGMIASSSRGALLGGAAAAMWMLFKSRYKVRGFTVLAVLAVVLYALIPAEQKGRLSDSGSDKTSVERLDMWKDGLQIAREHPLLGVGYFNWIPYRVAQGKRMLLSHNIFIQCMTELGYTGLMVLLALIGSMFWMNNESRRRLRRLPDRKPFLWSMAYGLDAALIGFLCSGFFVTVLYYPFLWINLAFTTALYSILKSLTGSPIARRAPSVQEHSLRALATQEPT